MNPSHHAVLVVLFLVLGCCVGSFLNVCVYRIPRCMSLFRPRSRCPRCLTAIRARDNIPVVGWLILRGECRQCGSPISPRYPIVELATGLVFAGVYLLEVALAPRDLWEDAGGFGVLAMLLMPWSAIGWAVVAGLIRHDARTDSLRSPQGCGVGGQDQELARRRPVGLGEPISIQFGDLVGAAGVTQAIAGDAPERLMAPNEVDRRLAASLLGDGAGT